jgi:hypothetical protein
VRIVPTGILRLDDVVAFGSNISEPIHGRHSWRRDASKIESQPALFRLMSAWHRHDYRARRLHRLGRKLFVLS